MPNLCTIDREVRNHPRSSSITSISRIVSRLAGRTRRRRKVRRRRCAGRLADRAMRFPARPLAVLVAVVRRLAARAAPFSRAARARRASYHSISIVFKHMSSETSDSSAMRRASTLGAAASGAGPTREPGNRTT